MCFHPLSVLSVLTAGILYSLATPLVWDNMRTKHAWSAVPANWECIGIPSPDTTINLRIALKPYRESALIDSLYEVSDPRSPKYGAHLSKEQVAELVAPHPETLELIKSWLGHYGVSSSSVSRTHGGSWLTVYEVPVSIANELLGASYQLYRHAGTNDVILRTVSYALPAALHTHVQTVAPTTHFASTRVLQQTPRSHSGGATASGETVNVLPRQKGVPIAPFPEMVTRRVTISFLRWLYKTDEYVPGGTGKNSLGIAGYLGQYPSPSDLTRFMSNFRADGDDATFTVVQVNGGGNDPDNPGFQANTDIQYTQGMAYPAQHIFYSTAGQPPFIPDNNIPTNDNEPYLDWLHYMLVQDNIPTTITTSYGSDEQTVPRDYATSVCDLFAQLGNRGVTVIFASGNFGVSGSGPDCTANDGSGKTQFLPVFPASCPWVTSVGGTSSHDPEVAASLSGGGFSNYFEVPDYQKSAISTFFGDFGSLQYAGKYNRSGRGIPDISAQALNYVVIYKERFQKVNGTHCASSTVAGVIWLLNDYLIRNGKRPLGFLNLWLYGDGRPALNDIEYGSNPGCGTDGFFAIPGWDPVTGLGTPHFQALVQRLDSHPPAPPNDARAMSGTRLHLP